MDLQTLGILILIGILAGMLGGMVGVGGGIIIVPALVFFLGFSQKMAQGTSLGILLLPVGLLGVIQYYKQGYVDLKIVMIISAGFFVGSLLGSKLALSISQETMKKIFAAILILVAVKMLFFEKPVSTTHSALEIKNKP
ncbi:MAG: permease [Ferruginibacter sp.]|uniref:sulfite exporter TauE/SafE family protein n=1 Tax=Ferruginibacter sp. TaxID=1940288 RepID=UPI0026595BD1|nr:sulfite exporter TauE/SafE family protein [Ferruginibacter sp.]MDB5279289.1 permease [Ferruginibacter sp.]